LDGFNGAKDLNYVNNRQYPCIMERFALKWSAVL
jgi:hypothetical protein